MCLHAVNPLLPDRLIFAGGLAPGVGDSSYNGGRLPDLTGPSAGGGPAATFNPKPGAGLQFYFAAGAVDGTRFAGLAFRLAADSNFLVDAGVTVGVQVAPGVPKVGGERSGLVPARAALLGRLGRGTVS